MREKLADLCHRQWSGWMEYLFGKCAFNPNDGTATIPKWAVDRWQHQLSTEYAHLSEEEKNSDRDEADRFLTLIAEAQPQADNISRDAITLVRQFARENGHSEGGVMDQYLDRLEERATAFVA